ncbi:MAG: efflux RND transporter periplasmic adaptor subunit [Myxococcota bacterium]
MSKTSFFRRFLSFIISFVPLILIIAVAIFVSSLGNSEDKLVKKKRKQPLVQIIKIKKQALTKYLEVTGSVEPVKLAKISSPGRGPVVSFLVREGDWVKADSPLVRLGRASGDQADAASAKSKMARQKLELQRIKTLVKKGAIAGEEYELARVKLKEARAAWAQAVEKLGDYLIKAPWEGIVQKVHVNVGDFVSISENLVDIYAPDSLVVRFSIPETQSVKINKQTEIKLKFDAHGDKSFQGRIARIYPEIDILTRSRTVEAVVEKNVNLLPGMFVRVQVSLVTKTDIMVVPTEAILRKKQQKPHVMVIKNNTTQKRPVETGMESRGKVEILSGVTPGETIAVRGHKRLGNGKKVRIFQPRKPVSKQKNNK